MKLIRKANVKSIFTLTICVAGLLILYFVEDKEAFINFFFIPTLLAGYIYGAKGGVLTAILSFLLICLISYTSLDNPTDFILRKGLLLGCFLVISGYIVGKLAEQITMTYFGTISALALAMESRDPYIYGHSARVAEVAVRIAKKLKLSKQEQNIIKTAGILHDIGKFGIREDILRKSSPLTSEEYDHIRQHPFIGVSILSPLRLLKDIIPYIYYHHEHIDGTGYLRKKDNQIPLGARILGVADAYEAMTTDRPYRKALSRDKIIKIFRNGSGKQFDKKIVDTLLDITGDLKSRIEAEERLKLY
ncbi:MAG: HD domain-containing protein [Candidatus Omnitrophica bacterium]|nr:HD domain-containing protein [Candidatus Omnitrophota bacterium]